jgi:hypothetical protein
MGKFLTMSLAVIFTILTLLLVVGKRNQHGGIQFIPSPVAPNDVAPMPLVPPLANDPIVRQTTPIAQRDEKYSWYLSATVIIRTDNGMGSGTIIYYDPTTSEAYVTSCGHLWEGSKNSAALKQRPEYCTIEVFYNQKKLDTKKQYRGTIIFRNFIWGEDVSLVKFTTDWVPNTFSIAPLTYEIHTGITYHSLGCDYDSEVAHYGVEITGYERGMLVTQYNSPRPGRSGGGLLTTEGYCIGSCSASDDQRGRGTGHGYFTSLQGIHAVYTRNGYDWLLKQPVHRLDQILIRDYTNPGKRPERDLLPFPRKHGILLR